MFRDRAVRKLDPRIRRVYFVRDDGIPTALISSTSTSLRPATERRRDQGSSRELRRRRVIDSETAKRGGSQNRAAASHAALARPSPVVTFSCRPSDVRPRPRPRLSSCRPQHRKCESLFNKNVTPFWRNAHAISQWVSVGVAIETASTLSATHANL